MWWWILAGVIVFVVPIVVLMRRGSGSGDPHYVPDQVHGSGPSTTPNQCLVVVSGMGRRCHQETGR